MKSQCMIGSGWHEDMSRWGAQCTQKSDVLSIFSIWDKWSNLKAFNDLAKWHKNMEISQIAF